MFKLPDIFGSKTPKFGIRCVTCGEEPPLDQQNPVFNCPNQGKPGWHILEKFLNLRGSQKPSFEEIEKSRCPTDNPYLNFLKFLGSAHLANLLLGEGEFKKIVSELNQLLREKIGQGFGKTPLLKLSSLGQELGFEEDGGIWAKVETGNITGSHKARHLMGTLLYLEVLRWRFQKEEKPNLAIYSCGNAALSAAALAFAADYPLDVFVPEQVSPTVLKEILHFNARVNLCVNSEFEQALTDLNSDLVSPEIRDICTNNRQKIFLKTNPQEREGDPTYLHFKKALERGALPFSCSGPDNWSNIEGGQTLYLELVEQLRNEGVELDSIVIQVGGGALASAGVQTFEELKKFGLIEKIPKIYAVQTKGGFPLVRAYFRLVRKICSENGWPCRLEVEGLSKEEEAEAISRYLNYRSLEIQHLVTLLRSHFKKPPFQSVLKFARENPEQFMEAWHQEPKSIAHGILDDITYDWYKIIVGLLESGGVPVIVSEEELERANQIVKEQAMRISVDHTGTAGMAGLISLKELGFIEPDERVGVLLTGKERN